MIFLNIYNRTKENIDTEKIKLIFEKIKKQIELEDKIVNKFKIVDPVQLNLIFVEDREMKKINRKYRGVNKTTDVLSFNLNDGEEFIMPNDKKMLGEIIISYAEAKKGADKLDIAMEKEIITLFVHGILHILGFDHEEKREKIEMEKMENKILKEINA